jgi:hypothetical protein
MQGGKTRLVEESSNVTYAETMGRLFLLSVFGRDAPGKKFV